MARRPSHASSLQADYVAHYTSLISQHPATRASTYYPPSIHILRESLQPPNAAFCREERGRSPMIEVPSLPRVPSIPPPQPLDVTKPTSPKSQRSPNSYGRLELNQLETRTREKCVDRANKSREGKITSLELMCDQRSRQSKFSEWDDTDGSKSLDIAPSLKRSSVDRGHQRQRSKRRRKTILIVMIPVVVMSLAAVATIAAVLGTSSVQHSSNQHNEAGVEPKRGKEKRTVEWRIK